MDVERSSLCNCVVNFLLEENYLLTAFELLHELLDDGRDAQAIRLKEYFADPSLFPPDQISRFNSLRVADPQSLLEEKQALHEKLALCEYELRLAQEDTSKLKEELQKKAELPSLENNSTNGNVSLDPPLDIIRQKKSTTMSNLGPVKDNERNDLNCAVKEYLLMAGYRLTAMTFYEEVTDQNLDAWPNSPACVPDALRHYYYQYLSSTEEAAEEKIAILREKESLLKENERLSHEKDCLQKNKEVADGQITALTRSIDSLQKELKEKDILVQKMKQLSENQRKELNDCRVEITYLKMQIEGWRSGKTQSTSNADHSQPHSLENPTEETNSMLMDTGEAETSLACAVFDSTIPEEIAQKEVIAVDVPEGESTSSVPVHGSTEFEALRSEDAESNTAEMLNGQANEVQKNSPEAMSPESGSQADADICGDKLPDNTSVSPALEKMNLETVQILADALPKIAPYVLIQHREELLPLMMCAIERHPESTTRDSLTHTLFNLIKRPDEQQRKIIMDACVNLAKNVGEMRTETELLPQCWEQINHKNEERRLLVAQSCGELAEFVRPEIRDSLILSIVQQLVEDSATVVREAAAHNLALLLLHFPNTEKYFKVEELMFQLVCDPAGVVVDATLKELVPTLVRWGNKLDHMLIVLLSHILNSAQRCPPLSGVEGSLESHLHVLGERERWNIDVLLRMLSELLPYVKQKAIETCPFSAASESAGMLFSESLLQLYARGQVVWSAFEWMHIECFPHLIQLVCLLPQKEDNLRARIAKFLLAVSEQYGDCYLTHIMLPVFLISIGDNADLTFFPSSILPKIEGLKPNSSVMERLATMCVMPLLLAGVLGAPSKREQLESYLRKLLVQDTSEEPHRLHAEIVDAVRFLCTFVEHHSMIFNILWEMVVSSNIDMKISAANLLRVLVPYIDSKLVSTHLLPALVTLGSDQNLSVKYSSIDAFGSVAQHFKSDMIVEKICIQMDAFLEDGSQEAMIAVVRALVVAVPHTTDKLRDYLLSKIFQFTASPVPISDVMRRRERANAFCEAIRALDATDLSAASVRDYLLPAIQNLLKDHDSLDPAHKEALEIIMKERSGGTFDAISKAMGAHLGIASSVTNLFGEGGLLGKKEALDSVVEPSEPPQPSPPPAAEDTRFKRIMRGNFADMLRGKAKNQDDNVPHQ
ncbi:lisH domain and HEAT repeat-containing protein KIAA1468 homolog [Chenopodium quinoa]|uniref:lisH domain and HEAT repeat-containing protein KIAA1468 homolog n=1 Tax=Chenopodium quinoa TaxID=63459 RepID=UPI000B773D92|nr:lisH domain and HEAT repeat-containing protein KIAA1468 homolog [Chenopodium quinoa]